MFTLKRFLPLSGALVTLAALCACADSELPRWFSNEPSKAELESYQGPVAMPPVDAAAEPYPNLADVPEAPRLSSVKEQADWRAKLAAENEKGAAVIADYGAAQAAAPPASTPDAKKKKKKTSRDFRKKRKAAE